MFTKNRNGKEGSPFAGGGLTRSPPMGDGRMAAIEATGSGSGSKSGSSITPTTSQTAGTPGEVLDGPWLTRAMNKNRDLLPKMAVVTEQLDAIIEFASSKSNISKDLKQSLLKLRKSVLAATQEQDRQDRVREVVVPEKVAKESQTDDSLLVLPGNTTTPEGAAQHTLIPGVTGPPKPPRRRRSKRPGGAGRNKDNPRVAGERVAANDPQPGKAERTDGDRPWTEVLRRKKRKKPERAKRARDRGDALILKTDGAKYSDVLKAMRTDTKLLGLGADVRCVRRTRSGDMILELKRNPSNRAHDHKRVAEEVLGDGVTVRALTSEVTVQCKNLDEITDAGELTHALKVQCDVELPATAVKLRRGPAGTQVATFRLPMTSANSVVKVGKLKVGWSICSLSIHQPLEVCFRCFGKGHKAWACRGPNRSALCRRCGEEGHKARECTKPPRCVICANGHNNHMLGGPKCKAFRGG